MRKLGWTVFITAILAIVWVGFVHAQAVVNKTQQDIDDALKQIKSCQDYIVDRQAFIDGLANDTQAPDVVSQLPYVKAQKPAQVMPPLDVQGTVKIGS